MMRNKRWWFVSEFRAVWFGETVSSMGSQISLTAIPIIAVAQLGASGSQLGVLRFCSYVPFVLFAVLAGVLVDMVSRRRILIVSNLIAASALMLLTGLLSWSVLTFIELDVLLFIIGCCSVAQNVAFPSLLPSIVAARDLRAANSKLAISQSVTELLGPGFSGFLLQILSAAWCCLLDSISFIVASCCILLVRERGERPRTEWRGTLRSLELPIFEALAVVRASFWLKVIAAYSGLFNFFKQMLDTALILFVLKVLDLPPAAFGFVVTVGGVGAILGAIISRYCVRDGQEAYSLPIGMSLCAVGGCFIWLSASLFFALSVTCLGQFLLGAGLSFSNVGAITLRQRITPLVLLGRVTGMSRFLSWGALPIGALAGGVFTERAGVSTVIAVAAVGFGLIFLILCGALFSHRPTAPLADPTDPSNGKIDHKRG